MKSYTLLCLVIAMTVRAKFSVAKPVQLGPSPDPEIDMSCGEIIQRWGYPVEEYNVSTDDGYILTIFRIPHGKDPEASKSDEPKPVVLLQHGLESSSYDWIVNLPNESAGYMFADSGFDVWLGNFRGNTYGQNHVSLNTKEREFWKFSWDEMAAHDLPAIIDTVLSVSQASNLWYVGHSMGTTAAFAEFSRNKDLEKKVNAFYALAPVTTVKHVKGALRVIAPFTRELDLFFRIVGYDEFLPSDALTHWLAKYFCPEPVAAMMCDDFAFLIVGPESDQLNTTRMPVYVSHLPAGTSTQTMAHYGQMVNSGNFQMYDYGRHQNEKHYGQHSPPLYDASQVDVPVYLYWGDSDWVADPEDVEALIPQLSNLVESHELTDYNHLDFIWGLRAPAEIYQPIIDGIRQQLSA